VRRKRDIAYAGERPERLAIAEGGLRLAEASAAETQMRQSDIEAAQAALAQATAAAQAAEVILGHATVKAPYGSVVVARLVDPGDMAVPGQPLFVVQPEEGYQLRCVVPEAQAQHLERKQKVEVIVDVLDGGPLTATIASIVPSTDPATRSSVVELDLPQKDGLRAGQFGRARIPIGKRAGIVVPGSAIRRHESLASVFVVDGARARRRVVRLGEDREDDLVEVISGLEGGETVIVTNVDRLVDGMAVEPKA